MSSTQGVPVSNGVDADESGLTVCAVTDDARVGAPRVTASASAYGTNADYLWDAFDSEAYKEHNYATLRDDDRRILVRIRDFFTTAFVLDAPGEKWASIDVGPGANLYPSLALLPYSRSIRLYEHSQSNVDWLRAEIFAEGGYRENWDEFWAVLCERTPYLLFENPREALKRAAELDRQSLLESPAALEAPLAPGAPRALHLPEATWDAGTMFFVAESLTGDHGEFARAVENFVRALRPGAPFAAAFMRLSEGYTVAGRRFPAVAITEDDVSELLLKLASEVDVRVLDEAPTLRAGYAGMIIATGRAGDN